MQMHVRCGVCFLLFSPLSTSMESRNLSPGIDIVLRLRCTVYSYYWGDNIKVDIGGEHSDKSDFHRKTAPLINRKR